MPNQQEQDLPPLIWPVDPAKAFQLIVCSKVPYGGEEVVPNSTEKAREPPQPKKNTNNNTKKEEEEEKKEDSTAPVVEELEEEMPIQQRIEQSMVRFRLNNQNQNQNNQQQLSTVEIGDQVELHLELNAVVSRFGKLKQQQQQMNPTTSTSSSSSTNNSSSNSNIEPIPEEATELHRRVKIGPIRWEAEISELSPTGVGVQKRFVPAPPCSRCFPFRDTHFNPTADHIGLKMRALAILQDSETDQTILFKHENGNSSSASSSSSRTTRPSIICSDYFQVLPSNQLNQIMNMSQKLGQFGFFAREKVVVDNEENSKNLVPSSMKKESNNTNNVDEEEKIEEKEEISKAAQQFLKTKTVEGKSLMIACKKFGAEKEEGEEPYIGIRIRYRSENEQGEVSQQNQNENPKTMLYEGKWRFPKNNDEDPVSMCSLSVNDDVTMTIHFTEVSNNNNNDEKEEEEETKMTRKEVQVLFNTRLDRDVAAAGMRSLM